MINAVTKFSISIAISGTDSKGNNYYFQNDDCIFLSYLNPYKNARASTYQPFY